MASQSSICKNKWHQISQPRYLPGLQALFTAQASAGHFQAGKLLLILVRNRNRKLGRPSFLLVLQGWRATTGSPIKVKGKRRRGGRPGPPLSLFPLLSFRWSAEEECCRRRRGMHAKEEGRKKEGFFYLFRSLGKSFRRLTSFAE